MGTELSSRLRTRADIYRTNRLVHRFTDMIAARHNTLYSVTARGQCKIQAPRIDKIELRICASNRGVSNRRFGMSDQAYLIHIK